MKNYVSKEELFERMPISKAVFTLTFPLRPQYNGKPFCS